MSASIFVFITLSGSTQARHLNTCWILGGPRYWLKLKCFSLLLAYFTAGSCLFFDIVYNQPRKLLCPFFEWPLVYTTSGMDRWFLCTFEWTIYCFIYKIKGDIGTVSNQNHSKHYSKLTLLFPLLLMWCSVVENNEDCIFLCILRYCSFPSATWRHFKQWLFNHARLLLKTITSNCHSECFCKCFSDLVTVTNAASGPENAVPVYNFFFAYKLFCLRMSTRSFNFNCVNRFFLIA